MQEVLRYNKKFAVEKLIAPENLPEFPLKSHEEFVKLESLLTVDAAVREYMVSKQFLKNNILYGIVTIIIKNLIHYTTFLVFYI